MKYAHIDENNNLLGWYTLDVHEVIPTPNIEVSDETWSEALNINANFYDGISFIHKESLITEDMLNIVPPTKEELMNKLLEIQQQILSLDEKSV